jgi:hypothetical protein
VSAGYDERRVRLEWRAVRCVYNQHVQVACVCLFATSNQCARLGLLDDRHDVHGFRRRDPALPHWQRLARWLLRFRL